MCVEFAPGCWPELRTCIMIPRRHPTAEAIMPTAMHIRSPALTALLFLCCACDNPRPGPVAPTGSATIVLTRTSDSTFRAGVAGWLDDTLRVLIATRTGEPIRGLEVKWSVSEPGGEIRPLVTHTLEDGSARAVWWLAATTDTQYVTVTIGNASSTFRGNVVPAPVAFTPAVASLWLGETLPIRAVVQDRNGNELRHSLEWISQDSNVAPVSANGTVAGRNIGETTLRIKGVEGGIRITVTPPGTKSIVAGRIAVVDSAAQLPIVSVRYRDSRGVGEGRSASDGSFRIELKHHIDPGDTSEVTILSEGHDALDYHPSIITLSSAAIDSSLTVILIPTSWQIRRGMYRGELVPISVSQALTPSGPVASGRSSFWQGSNVDQGRLFLFSHGIWPDTAFPVAVVLLPRSEAQPLASTDSARLWKQLDRLEDVIGANLFEPRVPAPSWSFSSQPDRTIIVTTALNAPMGGVSNDPNTVIRWSQTLPRQTAEPRRFQVQSYAIRSGGVTLNFDSTKSTHPVPVDHEFMHALGLGHGCNWPSATQTCDGVPEGGGTRTAYMSKWDVAYYELLRAVAERERALRTQLSVIPALLGERLITLKKTPLPGD
jgi:hypothetical protein